MSRAEPEEIDLATYKRLATKLPRKRAKKTNLSIPRAEPFERDGLSGLLLRGWCTESNAQGHRLYKVGGVSTGWFGTQAQACAEAKRLEREGARDA